MFKKKLTSCSAASTARRPFSCVRLQLNKQVIVYFCESANNHVQYVVHEMKNAKVMARDKRDDAAEKVMSAGKNPLKNSLFLAIWLLQ